MVGHRPWRNTGGCPLRQGANAKFPKKKSHHSAVERSLVIEVERYLHHRTHVRHSIEIVGGEFGFSSGLDLFPGFHDLFSKPNLGIWVFCELIQAPGDLSRSVGNICHGTPPSLTVMAVVSWAANMIVLGGAND